MKLARYSLLALVATLALAPSASAHQPVTLVKADAKASNSAILTDGTISWAVYTDFSKANQLRHFRFVLAANQNLKAEYLILDRKPENSLRNRELPEVKITTPSKRSIPLAITERTSFYEPFGGKNYLYLARIDRSGEAGIYTVTIRSKRAASVVIAVGSREVRGEVLRIGSNQGDCPKPDMSQLEIPIQAARQLIGVSESSAEICASVNNWGYRVAQRDGEDFPLTMDYRSNRINVRIEAGVISDVTVG